MSSAAECNILFEEFKIEFPHLTLADPCPICNRPGGGHPRAVKYNDTDGIPNSPGAAISGKDTFSAVSNSFIKLAKLLPKYNKNTDVRNFVKRLDLMLRTNEGIPRDKWSRVFLYVFEEVDQASLEWVMENIIEEDLSWIDAQAKFLAHFQRAEYFQQLRTKFRNCKQLNNESVQSFSDRFMDMVRELNRADDDDFTIDQFLLGVKKEIREDFEIELKRERIHRDEPSYAYTSLQKVIRACITSDVATRSPFTSGSGYGNVKTEDGKSSHGVDKSKSYCAIHKTNGHSTAECRQNNKNKAANAAASGGSQPSSAGGAKDKSHIQCRKCKSFGHYANECPSGSSTAAPSATTSTAAPVTAADATKRAVNAPQRLTYDAPGKPAGEQSKTAKSAVIQGTSADSRVDNVWLFDAATNRTFRTLVDCGANVSFIDAELARQLNVEIIPMAGVIELADDKMKSQRIGVTGILTFSAILVTNGSSEVITRKISHQFELIDLTTSKQQFVLGCDVLGQLFPDHMPVGYYSLLRTPTNGIPTSCVVNVVQPLVENVNSISINHVRLLDEIADAGSVQSEEIRERTSVSTPSSLEGEYGKHRESILNDPDVRAAIATNEQITGFCSLPESVVHLEVDEEFKRTGYRKQYAIPVTAHAAVDEQIKKWLQAGKIELAATNTAYNSPLVVACKKDAFGNFTGYRICLDTRMLNKHLVVTSIDRFQLPNIRSVLERFQNCTMFGELDLSEAYLQFKLDDASRPLTAFTWGGQQFQFVGAAFGISLLPSYFQRVMCNIFNDLDCTIPYIDNLPFGSINAEQHKQHLLQLLNRCNSVNLKVKLSHMKVAHSQMHCLGHLLTATGVALSPSKMDFVANAERPVTGKQLQSFIGVITYLRPNIRHMSELTSSLDAVKNVTGELIWTDRMIQDFNVLKQAIATAPSLAYPDFSRPFHIATDASNVGIGAVLYQPDGVNDDITSYNIVSIVSKKLNGAALNYSAYKKELYAIVFALRQFHAYVWGRDDLVIYTDHRPLTHMLDQRELSPALAQWLDVLLDYHFTINYRPGILNVLPDSLSRLYAATYDGSTWGVPRVMPWKIVGVPAEITNEAVNVDVQPSIKLVTIEDVSDAVNSPSSIVNDATQPIQVDTQVNVDGGGNAEALNQNVNNTSSSSDSDKLVEALLELEKRGFIIPAENERVGLIKAAHAFGHFGIEAVTRSLISKKHWWKGMRADVQNELANCDACNRYTVVRSGFNPANYITSTTPWEHVQMDTSVHLPAAPGGFTTLLVVIDVFTGFVILRPLKNSTAEVIANELWQIFCILGVPKVLQSDNGPEFTNLVIRTLVSLIGTQHRHISPYNPRADGKVERSIRSTMGIIKKLIHGNEKEWPLFVPFAQLAFNNKITSLTGSSPFSLMFGRNMNPLVDYSQSESDNKSEESNTGSLVDLENWKGHMENVQSLIYPAILERTTASKSNMVKRLDQRRRVLTENSFPNGAIVMVRDPTRTDKFQPKYLGPFSIIRRTRNGNFQLKDESGEVLDRHVPPDQLKLISKKPRQQDLETSAYEVEDIVGHKGQAGSYEYHTKFLGYPNAYWIPEENFADVTVIRRYWDKVNSS